MEWSTDNFVNEGRPRLNELVKMVDYKKHEGEFGNYRFVGELKPVCTITIPIFRDGKPLYSDKIKKNVEIPFYVTNYDYTTGKFIEGKECPFMKVAEFMNQYREKPIRPREQKLAQAINRMVQEDGSADNGVFRRKGNPTEKEKTTRKKDSLKSDCRTPVEVHTIGYMMSQDIRSVIETNTVVLVNPKNPAQKKKVAKPPTDPKYGCDVMIKYDGSVKANKKTFVQKGDRTPLTEDEKRFLQWDLDAAVAQLVMKPAEAKAEAARLLAEFKKSLKGGGSSRRAAEEPDTSDLPDDLENGNDDFGGDNDSPNFDDGDFEEKSATRSARPAAQRGGNAGQQRRQQSAKPAPVADEADSLFGSDDGLDLDDDSDIPF